MFVALVCLTSATSVCYAQGEHGRRAGAELRVLSGDVRKLIDLATSKADSTTLLQPGPGKKSIVEKVIVNKNLIKKGLIDRIIGSLSATDMLLRLADQESGRLPVSYLTLVHRALTHVKAEQWLPLGQLLLELEAKFPLVQLHFPESNVLLESSRQVHQRLCAGCHDNPITQVERPAYNLYQQSKSVSDVEFFARMLIGVRGDRVTGIDNPFTDAELAGLIYLYQSTTTE